MTGLARAARAGEWWEHKLAPVLATAYAAAFLTATSLVDAAGTLALVLLALIPGALYVSVLNDLTDREADRLAGKPNRLAGRAPGPWWAVVAAALATGAAIAWLAWRGEPALLAIYAGAWIAFALYSVPPVRLKARGAAGALADAAGAHVFPHLLAAAAVFAHADRPLVGAFAAAVGMWALAHGLRGAIWHQLLDAAADARSGLRTFGRAHPELARRLGMRLVFPVELAAFVAAVALADFAVAAVLLLLCALLERRRARWWRGELVVVAPARAPTYRIALAELYVVLYPISFLVAAGVRDPGDLAVLAAHVALFPRTLGRLVVESYRMLRRHSPAPAPEPARRPSPLPPAGGSAPSVRVLFLLRSDSDRLVGGTAEQLRQYARAVTERGGEAVVHTSPTRPPGRFDLTHVFNVDWPLETARHMDIALACADRVVLSPVHHDRRWEDAYHLQGRAGMHRRVASVVGLEGFLRLRGAAQAASTPRLWPEAGRQLVGGVGRRQRQILERADAWFVASPREAEAICADFGVAPRPFHVIRNGGDWVDDGSDLPPLPGEFALCVARVEARKNQLTLARALVDLGFPGVFVGAPNPRHQAFVARFAAYVDEHPSLTWLPTLGRRQTLAMFARARLHALASWYELAALVDSEAAVAGCSIVTTTRSHSRDVIGDAAVYWDPASGHDGLVAALRRGLARTPDAETVHRFRRELAWARIREDVARAYGLEELGAERSAPVGAVA
jgi:glycosyltransferase involved in cell wall biosynthesis/4-hydroxybenzoate polyprenyltransferase